MDEGSVRATARPYYDPETFNAGYTAVFRPDKGVVDPHGFNIASKLNIASVSNKALSISESNKKSDSFISNLLSSWTKGASNRGGERLSDIDINNASRLTDGIDVAGTKDFNDLEWNNLFSLNLWRKIFGQLLEDLSRKYFHHLIQQPFEVSRCLLQVGDFTDVLTIQRRSEKQLLPIVLQNEEDTDGIEDDEEIDYFPIKGNSEKPEIVSSKDGLHKETDYFSDNLIKPESLHVLDIMNSLIDKEGLRGLWRANNTTFIYNFLNVTLNIWFIGALSPFFGVSDPNFFDALLQSSSSYSPINDLKVTMLLTMFSNVLTNTILLPLDIIRTKLLVSCIKLPVSAANDENKNSREISRSLRELLRDWVWKRDFVKVPIDMWILTVMNALTANNGKSSVIFSEKMFTIIWIKQLQLTKNSKSIKWYNVGFCLFQVLGTFVKLPIETMLRRCQVDYLLTRRQETKDKIGIAEEELIIKPIAYNKSIFLFRSTSQNSETDIKNKVIALWNGWRISIVSLLCDYGLKLMRKEERAPELEF